jgi:hypothetical protein
MNKIYYNNSTQNYTDNTTNSTNYRRKKGASALSGTAIKTFSNLFKRFYPYRYGGTPLSSVKSTSTVNSIHFRSYAAAAYSQNFPISLNSSYQHSFSARSNFTYQVKTVNFRTSSRYSVRFYKNPYISYYNYSPYYSPNWSFFNNYYVYNYNKFYLRGKIDTNNTSPYPAEYSPIDWMPSVDPPNDLTAYLTKLNSIINSVKLTVDCCKSYCVTVVQSVDDGFSVKSSDPRTRIFIDIFKRNYVFLNPREMSVSSKKCIVDNLFQKFPNGTIPFSKQDQNKTLSIPQTCNMTGLFSNFPLKNSCRNQLSQFCGANNFDNLLERFFALNSTTRCGNMLVCENVTQSSSESDRLKCGAIFSSTFLKESFMPSFTGLTYPCRAINPNDGVRVTSFVEKNFLRARQVIATNTTSGYIDTSTLSTSQQSELKLLKRTVEYQVKIPVSIDTNSDFMMNSNIETDLRVINSNVLVQDYFSNSNVFYLSKVLIFFTFLFLF